MQQRKAPVLYACQSKNYIRKKLYFILDGCMRHCLLGTVQSQQHYYYQSLLHTTVKCSWHKELTTLQNSLLCNNIKQNFALINCEKQFVAIGLRRMKYQFSKLSLCWKFLVSSQWVVV